MNLGDSSIVNLCRAELSGTINVIYITVLLVRKVLRFICSPCCFLIQRQFIFCKALFFNDLIGRCCFLIFRNYRSCRFENLPNICYNYYRVMIGCLVVLGVAAYSKASENARLTPKGTIESDRLIVTIELVGGGNATALNCTLKYDPGKMEPMGLIPGSSVRAGEKNFADNIVAPGLWAMVVMGLNQRAIPDGNIAVAEFRLRTQQSEALEVVVEEPVLSTWDGEEIPVTGGRCEIVVKRTDVKQPEGSTPTEAATGTKAPKQSKVGAGSRSILGISQALRERDISNESQILSDPRQSVQQQTNPTPEISATHGSVAGRQAVQRDVIPNRKRSVGERDWAVAGLNEISDSDISDTENSSLTVEDEGLREAKKPFPSADNRSESESVSDIWVWGVVTSVGVVGVWVLAMRLRTMRRRR